MILILTSEAGDYSHPRFVEWLHYYKADYMTLSAESIIKGEEAVEYTSEGLLINGINLSKEVNIVFNRRWLVSAEIPHIINDDIFARDLKRNISRELYEFRDSFFHEFKNALWIPNLENFYVNKISNLSLAKKCGLLIPEYLITNSKEKLKDFVLFHKKIITKAIGNFTLSYTEDSYAVNPIYTKLVTKELIDLLPDHFMLSLFQRYIAKKKEYRVLYFNKKCYCVELLTQENDFSVIDSRRPDKSKEIKEEIRLVQSSLPINVSSSIVKFMTEINLNIGCLDLIQDENGNFYFLEVNPVGQISGYSHRANLNFEKEIVEYMIKEDQIKNEEKRIREIC
ncbi:hypothetical protein [Chryseobacterium profundimaris]|uniref:Glutathione synthase/RimK-type ligase, ATP-grasp superfamily n=1 Tax=Chryseobacterium profundimaris TaxID=1387275 RepID=A0ABY1NCJ5_9FLAO|nr:hypothetical protein [Chryseobacterium profundimaris]SMP06327.1 Glutathione synthase/RimK-type ligase, ATP-grasp superfamily [Chryseobacterium profundimaris]